MAGSVEEERNWPQTFFHDDVLSVRVFLNIRMHSDFGNVCTQLLGSHVPLAQRTKALKELSELVNTQRLEEVSMGRGMGVQMSYMQINNYYTASYTAHPMTHIPQGKQQNFYTVLLYILL